MYLRCSWCPFWGGGAVRAHTVTLTAPSGRWQIHHSTWLIFTCAEFHPCPHKIKNRLTPPTLPPTKIKRLKRRGHKAGNLDWEQWCQGASPRLEPGGPESSVTMVVLHKCRWGRRGLWWDSDAAPNRGQEFSSLGATQWAVGLVTSFIGKFLEHLLYTV